MLDGLVEAAARSIGSFIIEFVFYSIFYRIGWVMLKVLTLGQYPSRAPAAHNRELVAALPIVAGMAAITIALS
jgi:hypothetical protein